jgi:hypothetical protein
VYSVNSDPIKAVLPAVAVLPDGSVAPSLSASLPSAVIDANDPETPTLNAPA